jgi:hypothetical protein
MTYRDLKRQVLVYCGIGVVAWLGLGAVPGINNRNYSGGFYFVGVIASALFLGVIDPKSSHIRVGFLMAVPGLLLAAWTAPRGDNDGLWILWFPLLGISIFLVAGFHWIGSIARRAREHSRQS